MQLLDLFDLSFVGRRHDVALTYSSGEGVPTSLTFGDIDARTSRMARVLQARGLRSGDRLLLHLPNRVEFLDLFIAAVRLGVIVVPVNILYREREIAHIVHDAEPALSVVLAEHRGLFPEGSDVADVDSLAREADRESPERVRTTIDGDMPAAIVYTSGTTGRSKGAVLTHNNFLVNAVNLVMCWRITSADRYLAVLPLFHVHGLGNGVISWLASGCHMRLAERFDRRTAADLFTEFRPTLFFGVPTMYVRLMELESEVAAAIGREMRLFVSGSAPLAANVLEAFRDRFGHTILERYGMSESLMNMSNPYVGERRAGTVGLPLPGVSARIVDANGAVVGVNAVGHLEIRGGNLCAGYWRNPDATAAAYRDGWFRTGDLAEVSNDGYYTLRGRSSDLIISGGFNIYPREIEELLLEQAGVREAVVVGVPHAARGEVPVAYLVCDTDVGDAALRDACVRSLASFKVPRAFVRVASLPRTALGKVQRHLLPPPPPLQEGPA